MIEALTYLFMEKTVTKEKPYTVRISNSITKDKMIDFLIQFCNGIKFNLEPLNKKIILETSYLGVEDAKKYFGDDFDIYCLGMPNETEQNLREEIIKNDTGYEWVGGLGRIALESTCQRVIETSKIFQEECEEHNITFFDTSGNRKEKLEFAIEEIKKRSINH